ncbi:uncharacterized protein mRpL48 isoform X2 [Venturia canescens]|uniref:uncharacterized protein mRpL48 isoform X2 n=1 Tax=Venturia canescens TaxID=32260 RepID=UPI001C9C3677|nr:uncharacterized protein LOC122412199 isoform X2 [Venturia canescens]
MAIQGFKQLLGVGRSIAMHRFSLPRFYSLYIPDYLETGKSKIPLYPLLNIQLKSFDYPKLESFQKLIGTLTDSLDIDIENSWAFPPKCLKIQRLKPHSSVLLTEYSLNEYERNIQVEMSATQYPLLLRAMEAAVPEGVTFSIDYYDPNYELKRYVPDTELLNLKAELETVGDKNK